MAELPSNNRLVFAQQAGFSLLEVLVAFVVMGLVVGTLLQLYGTSMRGVSVADEMSYAIQIAESQMARVGREIKVQEGEERGDMERPSYHWKISMSAIELIEDSESFSLSVQPYKVVVQVDWGEGGNQREFQLSSIRFGEKE